MKRLATLFLPLLTAAAAVGLARAQSAPVAPADVVPGQFIVKVSAQTDDARREAERILAPLSGRLGRLSVRSWLLPQLVDRGSGLRKGTITRRGIDRIVLVEYANGDDPRAVVAAVRELVGLEYAEPVYRRYISALPNDPHLLRQWYLERIRAYDAWNAAAADSTITIAIVDTGIDWVHPDLADAVWRNHGETGRDTQGADRRSNRVDDDGNGFIDDWIGFDFAGSDARASDNDPRPGHWHGTHVAGIAAGIGNNAIGIAGVAHGARLMALKIADDRRDQPTLVNAYDAVLYAARMGASVINCSWGGPGHMQAEQDVIDAVTDEGALVVAAAGNEGRQSPAYPASYQSVLSVASVMAADRRSVFSNYNASVGISAPGDDIYSTLPFDQSQDGYGVADGTSMASPMVAGAAALVRARYPSLDPSQVSAVLRAGADNIDEKNPSYALMLGTGRLNVARALEVGPNAVMAGIESVAIADANANGIIEAGERFSLQVEVRNYLRATGDLVLRIENSSPSLLSAIDSVAPIGSMATGERRSIDSGAITVAVRSTDAFDQVVSLTLSLVDGTSVISSKRIDITVNPNYATTSTHRVATTFTGNGRIAFNDFPINSQGIGFRYGASDNLLAEGGLLVGTSPSRLADVVRSGEPGLQSEGLRTLRPYRVRASDDGDMEIGVAEFSDDHLLPSQRNGLHVTLTTHASHVAGRDNQVLLLYKIKNTSSVRFDRLHVALFLDWDIGIAGVNNQIQFDSENRLGYAYSALTAGQPYVGAMLVGNQPMNFYAADNNASPLSNGFFQHEKWETMSSGIRREESSLGDCSMIIGAGPIGLAAGADTTIAFALIAADDRAMLAAGATEARAALTRLGMPIGEPLLLPSALALLDGFPSPFAMSTRIQFTVPGEGHIDVDVFTAAGEHVAKLASGTFTRGLHSVDFAPEGSASQVYFIRMISEGETILKKVVRLGRSE